MAFFTHNWKPVKLKQVSYPVGGAIKNATTPHNWFQKLLLNSGKRKAKLKQYNLMDNTVDITRALDIIAEDISSDGADDNLMFIIDFPDDADPSTSELKTLKTMLRLWTKKTHFDYKFFDYIREMLKNGIVIFRKDKNGHLVKLIPERIEGYKLDQEDDNIITHYIYDPKAQYVNKNGDTVGSISSNNPQHNKEILGVDDLLVLKIGEGPYGEPVLDNVFRVWKQLVLLEDAVVIYRIVRAPERRVFYIDTGKMPQHKSQSYIESIKNAIKQKQVNRDATVETDYNPTSIGEDYFIGQTEGSRGSRVETLPGGENLGRIEDLQYFNKKLALGLRIPPSYLERQGDDTNGPTYNDGRVGTAYIAELRYVGYVRRLQKAISKFLFNDFKKFLKSNGVDPHKELQFSISPPQSFAVYKENELASILLNTYSSVEGIETMSKKYALEKYLNMSKEDIALNEELKLEEMGLDSKQIKKLTYNQRANLVYGGGTFTPEEVEDEATPDQESSDQKDDKIE
jgi:Bacteriophage T4-like portal protein (Gp20)